MGGLANRAGVTLVGVALVTGFGATAAGSPPPPGVHGGQVERVETAEPVAAVAIAPLTTDDLPDVVTVAPGRLAVRAAGVNGSLRAPVEQAIDVAAPLAVAPLVSPNGLAVIDSASRSMTLLAPRDFGTVDQQHPFVVAARVPLGGDPVAMAARGIDDNERALIAVAERGDGDVRLLFGHPSKAEISTTEVIKLGSAPTSVSIGEDARDGVPIVAVGTDHGVVVMYIGVDDRAHVTERVPIGGGVTSLAFVGPDADTDESLNADDLADLAALRADGALLTFRGSGLHGVVSKHPRIVDGPDAAGAAGAHVVSGSFGGDSASDIATVTTDGRVAITFGALRGAPRGGPHYPTGAGAGSPAVGDIAGDDHDDLAIPATASPEVRLLALGDDAQISADPTAAELASGLGYLLWWRRDPAGGQRLVEYADGAARDLPDRVPTLPPRTIVGRNTQGHAAVAYVRCSRLCNAEAFDLVTLRARTVDLPLTKGCGADSVAVWGHDIAYGFVHGRACRASRRGIWVRRAGHPPRRLPARRGLLGSLDADHVAWVAYTDDSARALVDGPTGRHLVGLLGVAEVDASMRGPMLVDGPAWWTEWDLTDSGETGTLMRALPDGRHCQASRRDLPTHRDELDAAVNGGTVYYAYDRGVFRASPRGIDWATQRCT